MLSRSLLVSAVALAVLSTAAPALAVPAPGFTPTRTSLTTRQEGGIQVPICVELDVELNLSDVLSGLLSGQSVDDVVGGLLDGIVGSIVGNVNVGKRQLSLGGLGGALSQILKPVTSALAPIQTALAPVVTPLDPLVSALNPVVSAVVSDVANPLITGVVNPVISPVASGVVDPLLSALDPAFSAVVSQVVNPVASGILQPAASGIASAVLDPVGSALAPVVSDLASAVVDPLASEVVAPAISGVQSAVLDPVATGLLDPLLTSALAPAATGIAGGLLDPLVSGIVNPVVSGVASAVAPVASSVASLVDGLTDDQLNLDLGRLCLCAVAGALTTESIASLDTAIQDNADQGLLGAVGELGSNLLDILEPISLGIIDNQGTPVCEYPADSTPIAPENQRCGSTCEFTCNSGFERSQDGLSCISLNGSAAAANKRSVKERSRFACRQPFTACPVSHFLARDSAAYGGGFECVDTTSNLESCGGCLNPFRGNAAGQDCTAIANVDTVSCTSGQCIVESCAPGFLPSADFTACEKRSRFSSSRLTLQARKVARK